MCSKNSYSCSVLVNKLCPSLNIVDYDHRDLGDVSSLNIKVCSSKKCIEFCPRFRPACRVYSSVTGRYIDCVNANFPQEINCKSVNVIYVITCSTCNLQYVGETVRMISERFYTHCRVILGKSLSNSCKRLRQHFTSGRCKDSEYTVQVVEKLGGNGRLVNGEIDPEFTRERRELEDGWMIKLRTVYPYGLNDSLNSTQDSNVQYSSREGVDGIVGKLFPALPRQHSRPGRVHNKNITVIEFDNFMLNVKQ